MEGRADQNKRQTLLVIDDDVEWTELLKVFFAQKYQVSVANSADAAIDAVRSTSPHAIILDLIMPSVDGFGFMHRINELSVDKVPTVLVTGWDRRAIAECAELMGCAAVLSKPISLGDLDEVVTALMDGKLGKTPQTNEVARQEGD